MLTMDDMLAIVQPHNDKLIAEGKLQNAEREIERLRVENWQLKGALGYPVPGNIPQGDFKCGLCEARAKASNGWPVTGKIGEQNGNFFEGS